MGFFPVPNNFLPQLPLLILFILPLLAAFLGLRNSNMKSCIHFQQGTKASSPWRVSITMTILTLPQFAFWCIFVGGPSAFLYQLGVSCSVLLCLLCTSGILHYIPSPSIFAYPQNRYQSKRLRIWLSILQVIISFLCALLLLVHSSTFIATVSTYSVYLIIPLVSFFSVFAIIFSGHSSIMTIALLLNIVCILGGLGLFLYYGIEDVTSLASIIPLHYPLSDCLISVFVGFIVSMYQLTSSPIMYQVYFPLSTIHKLRLSIIFYGVFQLLFSIFVFLVSSLFSAFLEKHCNLQFSFSSFFQFVKFTTPHITQSYVVSLSLLLILFLGLQWSLLSLSTHLWEEFIQHHLKQFSSIKQLCSLQLLVLLLASLLALFGEVVKFLQIPYAEYTPSIVIVLLTCSSIICAIFLCGYFFPCCNSKGASASFFLTFIFSFILFYLYFSHNNNPTIRNSCDIDTSANTTIIIRSFNIEKLMLFASYVPLYAHPIAAFLLSTILCIIISFLTGGQDQMTLDWNLIVCPCVGSLQSSSNYHKRPFVESESFRFAQHNPSLNVVK